ncbi:hypothetical protein ACFLT7_06065 [candidate division KSB1 bacterium]
MTYYKIGVVDRFIGTSTDGKPSSTGGIPYGSEFYEMDTMLTYILGSTGWGALRTGTKST